MSSENKKATFPCFCEVMEHHLQIQMDNSIPEKEGHSRLRDFKNLGNVEKTDECMCRTGNTK